MSEKPMNLKFKCAKSQSQRTMKICALYEA